jgi:hypothetical protein
LESINDFVLVISKENFEINFLNKELNEFLENFKISRETYNNKLFFNYFILNEVINDNKQKLNLRQLLENLKESNIS